MKIAWLIAVAASVGLTAHAQTALPAVNSAAAGAAAAPSTAAPAASPTPSTLPALDGRPAGAPGFVPDNPMPEPNMPFLRRLQFWLDAPAIPQDIDPKLFADFWRRWELVTTRYKPDGEEIRFIYVNPAGAETLAQRAYPFPPGAVFAKIGARAVQDPIFASSMVPGPIERIQVMWKAPTDPNARDGWVYSLYTPGHFAGHLSPDEIDACHACHVLARSRDMVFAEPFPTPCQTCDMPIGLSMCGRSPPPRVAGDLGTDRIEAHSRSRLAYSG